MTNTQKQEFTLRISQATSLSMIGILYEMTLCYLTEAKNAHQGNDKEAFSKSLRMAEKCIDELKSSLHMKYNPAPVLFKLYIQMHRKIAKSRVYFTTELIDEVADQLTRLRDAYAELEKNDTTESVMKNAQAVYAGLTYGKNSMMENTGSIETNRGFLV